MSKTPLSIVVPVYNENDNISAFYDRLEPVAQAVSGDDYEIIYVDDGSTDGTARALQDLCDKYHKVKLLKLSRNFGKEVALAAGIAAATKEAIITIDGDGQAPPEYIPQFIAAWQAGARVVVGLRTSNQGEGFIKRYGSKLFHKLFNMMSGPELLHGSSDFRLIDRTVQQEFVRLKEPDSMTRGLIDWLGFERAYVEYPAAARTAGDAGYSVRRLTKLAANSFVSSSPTPLYISGYLGIVITTASFLLGAFILIEQVLLGDPWHLKFSGTAMLSTLVLFLVGIVLISQGIVALYISHIHSQSKGRPLYIVDYRDSRGFTKDDPQK
jgi:glycosyltransferase involved in cell wall biosynthesis